MQVLCSRPFFIITAMFYNDLTIDRRKTILFIGKTSTNPENYADVLRCIDEEFKKLFSQGYDTVLFLSDDKFTTTVANTIRSQVNHDDRLFFLCVINAISDAAQSLPTDCFDEMVILEAEDEKMKKRTYYKYLLCCSGLVLTYDPDNNRDIDLIKSHALRMKMPIVEVDLISQKRSDNTTMAGE